MLPKPVHLSLAYAAQFQDPSVVAAYRHRPPHSEEIFTLLDHLITDVPRVVLDVGCGRGEIARPMAERVERVDAVDWSRNMIESGRGLPGGDRPNLRWTCSRVEDADLGPPYALITAGESLHWLDWDVVFPLFRDVLTPRGFLAIINRADSPVAWSRELGDLIQRYSTNRDFQPYNLLDELAVRGFFHQVGKRQGTPIPFRQSVDSYVEAIHSRNGFSRERMERAQATAFDTAVRGLVEPFTTDGQVDLQIYTTVVWGQP